jgi:quercetin dioxygenase-like cupin family protein
MKATTTLAAVADQWAVEDGGRMKTRVIRAGEGEILGSPLGCRDRFLVDSKDWGGNLAVVEHLLAPRAIAAPLHRHTKEDEFSLILEGRVWFNAADEPARLLELISPGGLEEAFRIIDTASDDVDLGPVIAPYGCEGDIEATLPIIEKYGLTFG